MNPKNYHFFNLVDKIAVGTKIGGP